MYIIIAGAGMIGGELALKLIENRHDVVIIDRDKEICDRLYSEIGVVAIYGNASRIETLKEAGIEKAEAGNHVGDISRAVQETVEKDGFSVVRDFVGHGVGKKLHEEPPIPNYKTPGRGPLLVPGMTLAIEPMVNMGAYEVEIEEDNWTVVTKDGKPSAHFEHTILISENGPEILTMQ